MGLPLFVAPVESDLKGKSSNKDLLNANGHPARSGIRPSRRRPEYREERTLRRRAAILREHFPTPGPEQQIPSPDHATSRNWEDTLFPSVGGIPPPYPWIESGQLPPPEAYNTASREGAAPAASRPTNHSTTTGRFARLNANQERLLSLLGSTIDRNVSPSPSLGRGEQTSARPRSRYGLLDDNNNDTLDIYRRDRIAPSVAARFDRSPDRSWRTRPAPVGQSAAPTWGRSQDNSRTRRSTTMDGLGDRTRSLSPEVWDTLLTTLTPDPQPPSVGSSFASASASASASTSQSAAASSRTSFTGAPATVNQSSEQPCEPGPEDSESEGAGLTEDEMAPQGGRSSLNVPSRHRRFIAALDSNERTSTSHVRAEDVSERPTLHFPGRPDPSDSQTAIRNRMRTFHVRAMQARLASPLADGTTLTSESRGTTSAPTREGSEEIRDGGDESGTDNFLATDSTRRGGDDVAWAGMQRIVRSLAERVDIPDEWWAEAGLSRAISDDA